MPPLIDDPTTPLYSSPTKPFSTKSISSPPSKQPHLSPPFHSYEGIENQMTAVDEQDDEDARLASLITDDAHWPVWIPMHEVWMSGGLGKRSEGEEREEGEDAKSEVKGCEEGEECSVEGGVDTEGSQGKESDSKKLTEWEEEEREIDCGDDGHGAGNEAGLGNMLS